MELADCDIEDDPVVYKGTLILLGCECRRNPNGNSELAPEESNYRFSGKVGSWNHPRTTLGLP